MENEDKKYVEKAFSMVNKGETDSEEDLKNTYKFFLTIASIVNIVFLGLAGLGLLAGLVGAVSNSEAMPLLAGLVGAVVIWCIRPFFVYGIKWFGYMLKTNYEMSKKK